MKNTYSVILYVNKYVLNTTLKINAKPCYKTSDAEWLHMAFFIWEKQNYAGGVLCIVAAVFPRWCYESRFGWRRSDSVLVLHHFWHSHDHAQGVAGGVHSRVGQSLPRHHQPLPSPAASARRTQELALSSCTFSVLLTLLPGAICFMLVVDTDCVYCMLKSDWEKHDVCIFVALRSVHFYTQICLCCYTDDKLSFSCWCTGTLFSQTFSNILLFFCNSARLTEFVVFVVCTIMLKSFISGSLSHVTCEKIGGWRWNIVWCTNGFVYILLRTVELVAYLYTAKSQLL